MSKLDFLLQAASRKVDAAAVKGNGSASADGSGEQGTSTEEKFDFILASVAERSAGPGSLLQRSPFAGDHPRFAAGMSGAEDRNDRETHDQSSEMDRSGKSNLVESSIIRPEIVQSVQFNLGGIAQISIPAASTQGQQETRSSTSKLLDFIRPSDDPDAGGQMRTLANGLPPKASVLHQEAHFKPVPNGTLPAELDIQAMPAADRQSPSDQIHSVRNDEKRTLAALGVTSKGSLGVGGESVQTVNSNATAPLDSAHGALVAQRIANAIVAEASSSRTPPSEEAAAELAPTSIVIKPSDGVLRVLNIQLHPVELGIVTVKMRLSGEQLEMELHTSSEETADILRKDTEKLSGLLRASGYRADVLSIHISTSDSGLQGDNTGQRQSSSGQSQSGNFQQNQSGRDEQARHASDGTKSHGFDKQKIGSGDVAATSGGGGVYL